jgi:hypothetical protein
MPAALHHELHSENGKRLVTLPEVEPLVDARIGEPGRDVIDVIAIGLTQPA